MCLKRLLRMSWRKWTIYLFALLYILMLLHALFNRNPRVMYNMPDLHTYHQNSSLCHVDTSRFGIVHVDLSEQLSLKKLNTLNNRVSMGGWWKPSDCQAVQKIAVLIPYRDRYCHLLVLLKRLHPLLRKQKIHYHIYVIEQVGDEPFNRGRLLNIGVNEALKDGPYDCFVLHDVDLLPEHDANLYLCDPHLRHLASAIDEMRYHVLYSNYAGGVAAISKQNFLLMNGFSNDYWGWGSEDDDFSARTMESGLLLSRPPEHIGRYKMVRHHKQWRVEWGFGLFLTWRSRWKTDGINTISSKYFVISKQLHTLFTNITVDIGKPVSPDTRNAPRESLWWLFRFFFP